MKKPSIIIAIVLGLLILTAAGAMAAPAVSVKSGVGAGTIGLEIGFPIDDSWSIIAVGGPIIGGGEGGLGMRYYLDPDGVRPFLSVYILGGYSASMYGVYIVIMRLTTAGLEYLAPGGFRIAAELGLDLSLYEPIMGLSMGYQF